MKDLPPLAPSAPLVLYQDANIIVVNKPAGFNVHKKNLNDPQKTLVDILAEKFPELHGVGEDPLRPGIVHRLDKYTSGVMIVARNQKIFGWLKKQFQDHHVEKEYLALVAGNPKKDSDIIDSPIGSLGLKKTTRKIAHGKARKWREARTEWHVLKRFGTYTLLRVVPRTGRTHQIRVHLGSIGYPIACDRLYGGKNVKCPAGLSRFFLHAARLRFSLPPNRRMEFAADLPQELEYVLTELRSA